MPPSIEDGICVRVSIPKLTTSWWRIRYARPNCTLCGSAVISLSGGEKQRVILARAIVQQPELLILDEPTNHLDIKFQFEVLDLVKDLNISTLCVLHNIELSARYCDYLYAMKQGRIVAEGVPNTLITKETIRTIYDVESEIYTNPVTQDLAVAFLPTRRK